MTKKKQKKNIIKRIAKWFGGLILILLILLITAPYLFKDKIKEMVMKSINENVNATVTFEELDLSFLKNFPLASVSLKKIDVINKAPFEGDTLFHTEELNLNMKLTELFKGSDESMNIQSFTINEGLVNILFDEHGNGNYDISIEKEVNPSSEQEDTVLSLGIQEYSIHNLDFKYYDINSKIEMKVDSIFHKGSGNFIQNSLDLDTKTEAKVSLEMDGTNYMNKVQVSLDAILGIDLENSKYTFKKNSAFINQLPLEFEGFIQLIGEESNQSYDLEFHTPTSSFKNLLGIVPEQYSGNIQEVKTAGNFDMSGTVKGILSENSIPTFDISFISKDAMFQYPDLPKSVQNINLNSQIINKTGNVNDTYISINTLSFTIDQDVFNANASISNLVQNPKIDMKANGVMNLENISKAYPIQLEQQLSGILRANVSSSFDMQSIEKKDYKNIKNAGTVALSNFVYEGKDVANPFLIENTSISFNTNSIQLKEFKAKTGETDLNIKGSLDNFYGFAFNQEVLKGDFNLTSNKINVNDFIAEGAETTEEETTQEMVKIPAFLDCTFKASAKSVHYDDIDLTNATGTLLVKDQAIDLQNLQMNAFSGLIKMNGLVSTKESKANFKMNLNLEDLDIKESFSKLNTLNSIAPIANVVGGKMNTNMKMDGDLSQNMTPKIQTISGDILGQLLNTQLNASNSKVLSFVGKEVPFIDLNKLNLEKIKTQITFKDGNVVVKPFKMKYEDINIEIGGTHGFDQSMNYNLTFDVPAKYLGSDVTNLLSKLSAKEQKNVGSIPVKAVLTGSFSNPKIKTDLKDATSSLVKRLVKQQKDDLIGKGKDKLLNLLGKDKDSTKSKKGNLINNLFKKKKKNN